MWARTPSLWPTRANESRFWGCGGRVLESFVKKTHTSTHKSNPFQSNCKAGTILSEGGDAGERQSGPHDFTQGSPWIWSLVKRNGIDSVVLVKQQSWRPSICTAATQPKAVENYIRGLKDIGALPPSQPPWWLSVGALVCSGLTKNKKSPPTFFFHMERGACSCSHIVAVHWWELYYSVSPRHPPLHPPYP
jgi:hypothetical protein